jgi:CheY-like chemotaxis protein
MLNTPPPSRSHRILIVEEDAILADVTAFRLELLGYQVETVHSAEDALEAVSRCRPDAILVDLALPGIGGIELTNRLSNDPETSAVPLMVLSASSDLKEVQRAHAAGANDFLVIPYDPTVLEEKIAELLLQAATTP